MFCRTEVDEGIANPPRPGGCGLGGGGGHYSDVPFIIVCCALVTAYMYICMGVCVFVWCVCV